MILMPADSTPCAETDPDLFFETTPAAIRAAKRLCAGCWFSADCAELGRTEEYGIWGGEKASGPGRSPYGLLRTGALAPALYAEILRAGPAAVAAARRVERATIVRFRREYERANGLSATA